MAETLIERERNSRKRIVKKKLKIKLKKAKEKAKTKLKRLRLDLKINICPKCGRHAYVAGICLSCHFRSRRRVKIEKLLEQTFNREMTKLEKLDK